MDNNTAKNFIRELRELNDSNRKRVVALRSFVMGIFQALGATIGFALVIILAGALTRLAGGIPIVSSILKETKLDVIIQNQLELIEKQQEQELSKPSPTPTPTISPTPNK